MDEHYEDLREFLMGRKTYAATQHAADEAAAALEDLEALLAEGKVLTAERDDGYSLMRGWKAVCDEKETVLVAEEKRRCEAETTLSDLQRSIASALFGAARDDERVPPERVSGALVDAIWPVSYKGTAALVAHAEAFLREEGRRNG